MRVLQAISRPVLADMVGSSGVRDESPRQSRLGEAPETNAWGRMRDSFVLTCKRREFTESICLMCSLCCMSQNVKFRYSPMPVDR